MTGSGGPPAIVVDDLSKHFRLYTERRSSLKERVVRRKPSSYHEFWALRDVSLEIPAGSTYGLIGHNGSGKSTLLKMMAGIHRPSSGSVSVHGRVSALLELGAGFHPELSGRDNIMLNGSILGLSKRQIRQSVDEIVAFSGLEEFIDTPVKVYSSGMYVRLGFSIAVNLDPEVLIVDEVITVGDEDFQRRCFDHLYELRRRGVTIVLVSHSLGIVQSMCDEVAWLDHGRLRATGDPVTVIDDYLAEVNSAERVRLDGEHAVHELEGQDGDPEADTGRRGSGEASLTKAELINGEGVSSQVVTHGEPMTVRLHYTTTSSVVDPVFGLAFRQENGLLVAGPNTMTSKTDISELSGSGHVDFTVASTPLVPGPYQVTIAITDRSTTHFYDHRERALQFRVQPGPGFQPPGVVALDGLWSSPVPEPSPSGHRGDVATS